MANRFKSEELVFITEASSSLSAQEIADKLGRSTDSIRQVCRKLGVKPRDTRGEAARAALTKYTPERLAEITEASAVMSTKEAAEYLGMPVGTLNDVRYRYGIPGRGRQRAHDPETRDLMSRTRRAIIRERFPEAGPWVCVQCSTEQPVENFYQAPSSDVPENHVCRRCQRSQRLRATYGITIEQYEQMADAQGGVCAICKQPETHTRKGQVFPLAVDHDHACCSGRKSCGKCLRGLLCGKCNHALGFIEVEHFDLQAAVRYLGL